MTALGVMGVTTPAEWLTKGGVGGSSTLGAASSLGIGGDVMPARFRLSSHETGSPSVIAKTPRGPARNGMVRRAASSTWIRGAGGGSFS